MKDCGTTMRGGIQGGVVVTEKYLEKSAGRCCPFDVAGQAHFTHQTCCLTAIGQVTPSKQTVNATHRDISTSSALFHCYLI